jgi:hypothetical protein
MTVVREPFDLWEPPKPRLTRDVLLLGLYGLGAALLAARSYELAFRRYQPAHGVLPGADHSLALTVARDAGLWAASATAAGALLLLLLILALRQIGGRLLRGAQARRMA